MNDDASPTTMPDLSAVSQRRAQLRQGAALVEQALAVGATRPTPAGSPSPTVELAAAVAELALTWQVHVQRSEDGDGLLAQVVLDVPRVAPLVARIRREHRQIADDLAAVTTALARAAAHGDQPDGEPSDGEPSSPRERDRAAVRAVLDRIARHRGAAGDLVHEAYHVDLGGE